MSGQRHRIRRQVLEIVLRDQDAAWPLQSEIGRIQRESLEAIVDRCCTEAGDPERLHRIEWLEVDLGHIHADNLEHDLVEKLGLRLREALAERIHAGDEATSLSGADPETISRLELLAFFARTGNLPWWADASRPRLLNETVGLLLRRAPGPLCALARTLARDLRALRRLVFHCEEERLSALVTALAAPGPLGLAERSAELRALLSPRWTIAGVMPGSFRSAVWVAVLRAVSIEESAGTGAVSFWRGTLAHAALELGVSYTFLVTRLHEALEPSRAERPDAAIAVVRSLYREVQGEAVASDSALHPEADSGAPGDGGAGEVVAILDRLERVGVLPSALLRELRAVARRSPARGPIPWLDELRELDQRAIAQGPGAPGTASSLVRLLRRVLVSRWLPQRALRRVLEEVETATPVGLPAEVLGEAQRLLREAIEALGGDATVTDSDAPLTDNDAPAAAAAEGTAATAEEAAGFADEVESLLDRLERSGLPLGALFTELRAAARREGAARRPAPLPDMPGHLPRSVLDALRDIEQQTLTHGLDASETASSVIRLLHSVIASRRLTPRALERAIEELERAAAASPPAQALGETQRLLRRAASREYEQSVFESPPLNLAYGDSEDVYVENAGLVILWPFLGHLFERLELLSNKRFKDRSAQHRAVGLLQYLATEDPSPPEYQVLLARVLCGMEMEEVFDFGPPVTETEAEECSNLLAAVVASAPILKEMSVAAFRGSFLLRKGVLGARDGSWLLRVERLTYDVVLDRFPWGMSWVKLPWMDTPLSVEW